MRHGNLPMTLLALILFGALFIIAMTPEVNAVWVPDGIPIAPYPAWQSNPQIISDGTGGAIITWQDRRGGGDWDIYAQQLDTDGTALWGADGLVVCTQTGDQATPTITPDGAGGAIITWEDERSGSDMDIYAQRIDANGSIHIGWTVNGVAICTLTDPQFGPKITTDGAEGAIITWEDYGPNTSSIYAQRVDANGTTLWADGVGIALASWNQEDPQISSDGSGGAIVTWQDLWGDSLWADGYFAETVGVSDESMIRKYIREQRR